MLVKDISIINPSCSSREIFSDFINYVDTSSVTEGVLSGIQYLTSEYPSRAQREVLQNDILISSVRPNLKHNYFADSITQHMVASTGFIHIRVTDFEKISPRFLYYFLTSPTCVSNYIRVADTAQSSYPSFGKEVVENTCLPDFDLPTQRHIASILGSLDEKIEINRKKIEKLEALARMIYEHWFVQFDFPDTNGKPYKSSGGAMVWNEELKQEIPDGWRVVSFADIVDIEKDSVAPDEFKHLTVEHYSIPAFDEKHWPTFEYGTEIASNKFRVNNREFLVSKLNPQFKRIWNPICKTENALCSTEFMVFKPKNDEMKSYCYSVADGIAFYNFMVAHASSSTGSRKRFPAENIQFFKFAHPGKNAILEQFDSIQKENLIQISLCYASIEKLIALRDWLLPMLMNGQVTVGE